MLLEIKDIITRIWSMGDVLEHTNTTKKNYCVCPGMEV